MPSSDYPGCQPLHRLPGSDRFSRSTGRLATSKSDGIAAAGAPPAAPCARVGRLCAVGSPDRGGWCPSRADMWAPAPRIARQVPKSGGYAASAPRIVRTGAQVGRLRAPGFAPGHQGARVGRLRATRSCKGACRCPGWAVTSRRCRSGRVRARVGRLIGAWRRAPVGARVGRSSEPSRRNGRVCAQVGQIKRRPISRADAGRTAT